MVPPAAGEAFEWTSSSMGPVLGARPLRHVPHGWTTRHLSLRGERRVEQAGWGTIAGLAGLGPEHLVRLRQVHGNRVHLASDRPSQQAPEADIAITGREDLVLAVQVADCAPVLVADRDGRAVAAAHAGWRGTAADVAGETVRALVGSLGVPADSLTAAVGPSIGPCCYQVGAELLEAFAAGGWPEQQRARWFSRRSGSLWLDVWQANADQLVAAGVPASQVHVSRLCTACHPGWFSSYRREGAGTGRLAGFIRPRSSRV